MFDFTIETLPCPSCGASTEAARFARTKAVLFLCDACAAADAGRRRHEDRRMQCLELWRDCTPADFQIPLREAEISPDLLPVLKMPGTEGVGLIGPCRAGKTRVAYRLLKKAAAAGLKPYAITASAYRQAVRDATCDDRDAKGRARTALAACKHAQVLLYDDVGKGAVSDKADEALYELLTYRRDERLVTHWTANQAGSWIRHRYGSDRGPAIAIRLANLAGCYGPGQGRIFTVSDAPLG